jgi:lysyl-tRNA synthetase class 2
VTEPGPPGAPPDERAVRRARLDALRASGADPFAETSFPDRRPIGEVRELYEGLEPGAEGDPDADRVRLAGRIVARRGQGKATFADLVDRTGRIQLWARLDALGDDAYGRFAELDLGDLVGIEGTPLRTRRGELSVRVTGWRLLAKALAPLPDKHHGLRDVELRYRRRYLDLIANEESFARFLTRSRIIAAIRRFLDDRGFVEVETPVLQPLYGGAAARPFVTRFEALDRTMYLRIATELYLKRLIVGGLEKVYEIGKDFRNEGLSFKHNPEFTMLETYEAYVDYRHVMAMTEELVAFAAREALGATTVRVGDAEVDLAPPWRRITLRDGIREASGIDILEFPDDAPGLRAAAARAGVEVPEGATYAKAVDVLLTDLIEARVVEPTFVCDYPFELSPFAKRRADDPRLVERFEAFVGGMEIANAFSELNDPDEQRRRFEQQRADRAAGDDEAHQMDEDFLTALEHGMPPTGGLGVGIDRLTMLLTGQRAIRDVILFPALRDP